MHDHPWCEQINMKGSLQRDGQRLAIPRIAGWPSQVLRFLFTVVPMNGSMHVDGRKRGFFNFALGGADAGCKTQPKRSTSIRQNEDDP